MLAHLSFGRLVHVVQMLSSFPQVAEVLLTFTTVCGVQGLLCFWWFLLGCICKVSPDTEQRSKSAGFACSCLNHVAMFWVHYYLALECITVLPFNLGCLQHLVGWLTMSNCLNTFNRIACCDSQGLGSSMWHVIVHHALEITRGQQ